MREGGIGKKKREDFEHQEVLEASRNMKEGTEGRMKKISTNINIEIWDKEVKRDL